MAYKTHLGQIVEELADRPVISAEDLPDIDLYVDQITSLVEKQLGDTRRTPKEKLLTKTMINNYCKEGILNRIRGKKYSREHILMLMLLYDLKQTLPLADVKALMDAAAPQITGEENHYDKEAVEALSSRYREMSRFGGSQAARITEEAARQFDLRDESGLGLLECALYLSSLSKLLTSAAQRLIDDWQPPMDPREEPVPEEEKAEEEAPVCAAPEEEDAAQNQQ